MSPMNWLNQLLNIILPLLSCHIDEKKFKKYLLALILEDKYFSVRRFSRKTKEYSLDQFYYFLKTTINWNNTVDPMSRTIFKVF